jgi:hypothetical protein
LFGPVEDLDVQGTDEGFDQVGRGGVELAGQVGQFVEQGRILVRGGGGGQVIKLGLGAGVLVVQVGVPGLDALPVLLGGGLVSAPRRSSSVSSPAWGVAMRANSAVSRSCWRWRAAACSALAAGMRSASMAARSWPNTHWSRNRVMAAMIVLCRMDTEVAGWSGWAAAWRGLDGL